MTREEAKKILERIVNTSNELTHPVILNTEMGAIKVAIGALKNEEVQLKSMIEYLHNTGWLQEHIKSVVGQQWIPCSERLPKTNGVYIVARWFGDGCEKRILSDACYFDGSDTWYDDTRLNHGREYVTHKIVAWMPLPSPYKENKS